jgi:hypothetical protein
MHLSSHPTQVKIALQSTNESAIEAERSHLISCGKELHQPTDRRKLEGLLISPVTQLRGPHNPNWARNLGLRTSTSALLTESKH